MRGRGVRAVGWLGVGVWLIKETMQMDDLIAALLIFKKYKNVQHPTNCSHDELAIMAVSEEEVTTEDAVELDRLGFIFSKSNDCWISFRFGSA